MDIVSKKEDIKRIRTYIEGLDDNIQGGIPEGHITLIAGSSGTMKSSLCFNILYNEARNGKTGLYISLEQSHVSLINQMVNLGYDFSQINLIPINNLANLKTEISKTKLSDRGSLIMVDIGCIRKQVKDIQIDDNRSWLNVIKNIIKKIRKETPCSLFTLDSLSAFYVLSKFKNPRIELFYIFEFLRDHELTSFLITETPINVTSYGDYDEDFLSDSIIHLRLTPFRRNVVREISVVKMRATKCNNDIFSLEYKNGKFHALYGGQNPLL
jgi:KaiC/GvpD/RAD55 family RecA-like ATPase